MIGISDAEFALFRGFILDAAGISLPESRKPIVGARLGGRLNHHRLKSFADYFELLRDGRLPDEKQIAIDLLTTNETRLFREPAHFERLRELALRARGRTTRFRAWSAACSSGEEAYSIAMVLDDCLPSGAWEVLGSDISLRMLRLARRGQYALGRAQNVPAAYLRHYCLRGVAAEAGTLLVKRSLRAKVDFRQINLNSGLPPIGLFDVIFLSNVLIYFDLEAKRQILARVAGQLCDGGWLLTGHSESMHGITDGWTLVAPAVYRRA